MNLPGRQDLPPGVTLLDVCPDQPTCEQCGQETTGEKPICEECEEKEVATALKTYKARVDIGTVMTVQVEAENEYEAQELLEQEAIANCDGWLAARVIEFIYE